MHALYLFSVWMHILAAVTWIGGMAFVVLVVVPWLRRGDRASAARFLRDTGVRFRSIGWTCFAILIVTGSYNLWVGGVRWHHLVDPAWLGAPYGQAVLFKLSFVALVLVVSAVHDFVIGPRASDAVERDPNSPDAERLRRWASRLGRANALLALVIVAFAIIIVRGWP